MKGSIRRVIVAVCVAGAAALTASAWFTTGWIRSEDRNRDGRPDIWRFYDARAELTRVATDTNFDGRSDQQDYYAHGALIRRERDRNFDDRVDLIESFDPTSHEQIRSVVDVDFNGTADLLVLFRNGHPVFSEWLPAEASTPAIRIASREPGAPLAPLADSSRHQAALDAVILHSSANGTVAVLSVMGLPEARLDTCTCAVVTGLRASPARAQALRSLALSRHSPRGPPPASLV
jgi:hypothetical protein